MIGVCRYDYISAMTRNGEQERRGLVPRPLSIVCMSVCQVSLSIVLCRVPKCNKSLKGGVGQGGDIKPFQSTN